MNNTAIYKVIENGKETNLHSSFAGGYSYPILLYTKAEKIAADMRSNGSLSKCGIADVLLLMTADDIFPEEHKGKKIFCPGSVWDDHFFTDRRIERHDDYSFFITLNYDKREIRYRYNLNTFGFDLDDHTLVIGSDEYEDITGYEITDPAERERIYHNVLKQHSGTYWAEWEPVITAKCVLNRRVYSFSLPLPEGEIYRIKHNYHLSDIDEMKVESAVTNQKYLDFALCCTGKTLSGLQELALWTCKQRMKNIYPNPLQVFAAVMMTADEHTMSEVLAVTKNIWRYKLCIALHDEDYGRTVIDDNPGSETAEQLLEGVKAFINYDEYGEWKVKKDGMIETDFGYVGLRTAAEMRDRKGKTNG